jgi:hypothetical protein
MRFAKGFISNPKLEFGGLPDPDGKPKKTAPDSEDQLWVDQQEMLAGHRRNLWDLARDNKGGSDDEIKETYMMIANKMHVASWDSLLPAFDALEKLGAEYQRGFVVLGGWHHQGDLTKITSPPIDLLKGLDDVRALLRTFFWAERVFKAKPDTLSNAQAELRKCLAAVPGLPADLWQEPYMLMIETDKKLKVLRRVLEHKFLFLQQRLFIFSPTEADPLAGHEDFYQFVFAYRNMVSQFGSKFSDYYWGVYLPKK